MTLRRHWETLGIVALTAALAAVAGVTFLRQPAHQAAVPTSSKDASQVSAAPPCENPPRSGFLALDPSSVTILQYGGINDKPPLGLMAHVFVRDVKEASALVQTLNALPSFPCGVIVCPLDDGSYFALSFEYPGYTSTVKVQARGCQGVYFGSGTDPAAWAINSAQFFDNARRLLAAGS